MSRGRSRDAEFTTPSGDLPFAVRALNAVGKPLRGRIDLSSDALLAKATASLPDDAEDAFEFRDALDALCHSMMHENDLHTIGRITARDDTARLVRTQIEVNLELQRNPAILDTPLPRPIYVIGWPRTGSTVLHTVLAQDPAHRALLYYEGFDPSAPAKGGPDRRIQKLGRMLRALETVQPGYRAIHPMEADSVEECVTVLYHTFSTPQFEFQYECPTYQAFLERQGTLGPYTHYRKQLQMLQHFRPHGERWVLKDPTHLIALDSLLELFPDARFVWIHRDPVRSLSSIASLTAHTRALFSSDFSAEQIGESVTTGYWARSLERGIALREKLPADRFIDVRYADFMSDPIATVARIYGALGIEFTAGARNAMQAHLAANAQGSQGVHRHSPERFGIDVETQRKRYRDYCERFGIPEEASPALRAG